MPPQITSPNVSGDWRPCHSSDDEDGYDRSAVEMGSEVCAIGVPFIGSGGVGVSGGLGRDTVACRIVLVRPKQAGCCKFASNRRKHGAQWLLSVRYVSFCQRPKVDHWQCVRIFLECPGGISMIKCLKGFSVLGWCQASEKKPDALTQINAILLGTGESLVIFARCAAAFRSTKTFAPRSIFSGSP